MSKPKGTIRALNVNRYLLHRQSLITDKVEDLEQMMKAILNSKIHGISFSPYLEGQDPSDKVIISPEQIAYRLEIIRPYTKWVRIFSSSYGNEVVPRIAKEKGLAIVCVVICRMFVQKCVDRSYLSVAPLLSCWLNCLNWKCRRLVKV